jgi:RNA polymerase sigma factor (sigma-70 family)
MGGRGPGTFGCQMRTLFAAGTFTGVSDQQLLERFVTSRDASSELAFKVLFERHGPMVLAVCRRILLDPQDVEDAFQATFLVMVRKAGSIRVEGSVGRWLFGVAVRVASRARALARRRRMRERPGLDQLQVVGREPSRTAADLADLSMILAEELGRLPPLFQAAVASCDVEGLSHEEAAQRLGWPVGTVKSRLSRARARLRQRLTQRGLAPRNLSIALPFVRASLPQSLVEATAQVTRSYISGRMASAAIVRASVASLTEGVLQAMLWTKIKLAAIAVVLLASSSAAVLRQASAQKLAGEGVTVAAPALPNRGSSGALRDEAALDVVVLQRAWFDAVSRGDAAVVDRILADDFMGIGADGNVFTKAAYVSDLRHGVFSTETSELDEMTTRILGDTAVVTFRNKAKGSQRSVRVTAIYTKREGRWQCVASHGCSIGASTRSEVTTPGQARTVAQLPAARTPEARARADRLMKIRPRFQCLVEKIHVKPGQTVGVDDPLADLFSAALAGAKNEFLSKEIYWNHDQRLLQLREKLHKTKSIAEQLWVDTQNDAEKSKLEFQVARDKLRILGLDDEAIERVPKEDGAQKARLTRRSPVAGTVVEVGAEAGNLYDTNSVLLVIETD